MRVRAMSTHWPGASSDAAVRNIDKNHTMNSGCVTSLEHVGVRNARGHALGRRELGPEQPHAVDQGGDEHDRELDPPAEVELPDQQAHQAADDDAHGPPRVQHVQAMRLVFGVEGGGEGVDGRLHQPPADAAQQHARPDRPVDAERTLRGRRRRP